MATTVCRNPRCDCDAGEFHLCEGGCGQLVPINWIGIATCGIPNCRSYAETERRADLAGARI